jgi:hypothetical protein
MPTLFVGLALLAPATLQAQDGDLLVIERKTDLRGRDLLLRRIKQVRITLSFHDASAEEIAQYLTVAAGKGITFIVFSRTLKPSELPKLTLTLKGLSLANAMAVISTQTGLRYVYRSGVVFIRPKDEVKEFTYLQLYDVRAATMKMPNFRAPKLGLSLGEEGGNLEEPEESDTTVSGFDSEKLMDLVRTMVLPESWDSEGTSIAEMNGILMVRQTESGQRRVRELLVKLGAVPPIHYIVRRPRYQPPLFSRAPRSRSKPTAGKPTAGKPTAGKPTADKPTADKPTADKPAKKKEAR